MWIVVEEAVYRHRILGVFDSQTGAEDRARAVSMEGGRYGTPGDGHHDYVVGHLPLNESVDDFTHVCSFNKGVRTES